MADLRPGAVPGLGAGRPDPQPPAGAGHHPHAAPPGGGVGGGAGGGLCRGRLRPGGGPSVGAVLSRWLRRAGVRHGAGRYGYRRGVPVRPEPVLSQLSAVLGGGAGGAGRPADPADPVPPGGDPGRAAPDRCAGGGPLPVLDPRGLLDLPPDLRAAPSWPEAGGDPRERR